MSYLNEKNLAINLANKINSSKNKEEETKNALKEIELLVEENQITLQEKKVILKELHQLLSLPPRLKSGHFVLLEQFENKHYLQMIKNAYLFIDVEKEEYKNINKTDNKNKQ